MTKTDINLREEIENVSHDDGLGEYVKRINRAVNHKGRGDHEDVRSILKDFLTKILETVPCEEKKPHGTTHDSSEGICTQCAERNKHNRLAKKVRAWREKIKEEMK